LIGSIGQRDLSVILAWVCSPDMHKILLFDKSHIILNVVSNFAGFVINTHYVKDMNFVLITKLTKKERYC
jgi:hypothetical protein